MNTTFATVESSQIGVSRFKVYDFRIKGEGLGVRVYPK